MRKFTSGDSSIHKCYYSDNFYRYIGYPTTYTEKPNEPWKIMSGSWYIGSSTIPQYGYLSTSTSGARIVINETFTTLGMFSRMRTIDTNDVNATIVMREGTISPYNKYYIRQYKTMTSGKSLALVRLLTSAETLIDYSDDPAFLDDGTTKEITAVIGSTLRLWINNKPVKWHSTGTYESVATTEFASGRFGLRNDTTSKEVNFFNAAFFEVASTNKGNLWDEFYLLDYTERGDTKTGTMRIPGKIGSHIQTSSPDSKTYTLSGRLTKGIMNAKLFDEMINRMIANQFPIFIHTPAFKTSGIITSYNPPKPRKGSLDVYHDFDLTFVENWFYEV